MVLGFKGFGFGMGLFERVGYEGFRKGSGRRPAFSCGHTIILVKNKTGKSKNYASSDTKAKIREKLTDLDWVLSFLIFRSTC